MRLALLLSFFLALPALAQNTGTLMGRVVDERSGDGVEDAAVLLDGVDTVERTDSTGAFRIDNAPAGHRQVEAVAEWHTMVRRLVEIQPNGSTRVHMRLFPGLLIAYEQPIIQICEIGVPRVVTGGEIANLPIRWADVSGSIVGRVTDKETGDGLPGANVTVEGTSLGAATDLDGYFRIDEVSIGMYSVTASFVGYEERTYGDVVVSQDVETKVSVGLEDNAPPCGPPFLCACPRPLISPYPFASRVVFGRDYAGKCGCDCGTIDLVSLPVGR